MDLKQVMIFVADINEAREFYIDKLGLTIERDLSKEHGMIKMKNAGCVLTIHDKFARRALSGERKIVVAFGVDDIIAETEKLKRKGIQLVDGIEETPVHWYQAFLDPSGNMLEIVQYKHTAQQGDTSRPDVKDIKKDR